MEPVEPPRDLVPPTLPHLARAASDAVRRPLRYHDTLLVPWHRRAGLFLAIRYLRRHSVPIRDTPLEELPRLSRRMIAFALRLFPRFLARADLAFPIIVAGEGTFQVALDGRHRISKAIWQGESHLPTVRVPWWYCLELLTPGVFEVEWLILFLRDELRRTGHAPPRP